MKWLNTKSENAKHNIIVLMLMQQKWLLGCTASDPDDPETFVIEKALRYYVSGELVKTMKNPVFAEYDISENDEGSEYRGRLHDSLAIPIKNGADVDEIAQSITETYDAIIIDDGGIDTRNIYGKLFTENEDTVVYINSEG